MKDQWGEVRKGKCSSVITIFKKIADNHKTICVIAWFFYFIPVSMQRSQQRKFVMCMDAYWKWKGARGGLEN